MKKQIASVINYSPPTLHTGKTTKDCYIDWYVYDDGATIRKRVSLNKIDEKQRATYASKLMDQITKCLDAGQDPFNHIPFLQHRIKKFGKNPNQLKDIGFEDGYNQYLKLLNQKGRREETTGITYKYIYKEFDDFLKLNFNVKYVHQIKDAHTISYFDYLLNKPVSGATHDNHLYIMRSLWNKFFIKRNAAVKNPFMAVEPVKPKKKKNKAKYTTDQLQKVQEFIINENKYMWSIFGLVFYCFMRPIEITRLYIRNINFTAGFIMLDPDQVKDGENRLVKIPSELLQHLIDLGYDKLPAETLFIGNTDFSPGNNKIKRRKITDAATRMLKNMGIDNPELRLYRLKHTGISKFRADGGDKEIAKFQAGHNNDEEHYTYYDEFPVEKYKQLENFSITKKANAPTTPPPK